MVDDAFLRFVVQSVSDARAETPLSNDEQALLDRMMLAFLRVRPIELRFDYYPRVLGRMSIFFYAFSKLFTGRTVFPLGRQFFAHGCGSTPNIIVYAAILWIFDIVMTVLLTVFAILGVLIGWLLDIFVCAVCCCKDNAGNGTFSIEYSAFLVTHYVTVTYRDSKGHTRTRREPRGPREEGAVTASFGYMFSCRNRLQSLFEEDFYSTSYEAKFPDYVSSDPLRRNAPLAWPPGWVDHSWSFLDGRTIAVGNMGARGATVVPAGMVIASSSAVSSPVVAQAPASDVPPEELASYGNEGGLAVPPPQPAYVMPPSGYGYVQPGAPAMYGAPAPVQPVYANAPPPMYGAPAVAQPYPAQPPPPAQGGSFTPVSPQPAPADNAQQPPSW